MSSYRIGMNLRVTEDSNQGGRRYMEDRHAIRFVKNDEGGFEFAYFAIFDGHGGGEASKYARDYLLDEITKYDCFWSDNDDDILYAIKSAFLDTHYGMWKELEKWPRTASGLPSTAGTTASICIIKNSKLYIGHVGDSAIVLGYNDSRDEKIIRPKAKLLTKEHKPDDPTEKMRIEGSGGQVVAKSGVQRVVWNRPRTDHRGPIRRSTQIDKIPFLAVARSLGDLWSYNYLKEEFVVSPDPDVSVHKLDPAKDKCLIIGSDGLWNMVTSEESVNMVMELEHQFEYKVINDPTVPVSYWINPAERLVQTALNKWRIRFMKADNTSAIVVLIDPLGPRKLSILKKKREERMKELSENNKITDDITVSMLTAKETLTRSPKKCKDKNVKPVPGKSDFVPFMGLDESMKPDVKKWTERNHVSSPMHKFTDNLDDSIQLRNSHLASPVNSGKKTESKTNKSSSPQNKTRTSPLQTISSENYVRTGMATRNSPQKSPIDSKGVTGSTSDSKSKKDSENIKMGMQSKSPNSQSGTSQGDQKCLQPTKTLVDNLKSSGHGGKVTTNIKVKDIENFYSSSEVKLRIKNLNIGKTNTPKNLNNSNISDGKRSTKKSFTAKSLSSRISLRLRRLRQRRTKAKAKSENDSFVVKAGSKRKLESQSSGLPASKKLRHS